MCAAINNPQLSAARNTDGNFAIDPAELFCAYTQGEDVAPERSEKRLQGHGATVFDTTEWRVRNAQLEDKLRALRLLRWPWRRSDLHFRVRATSETGSSSGSASTRMRASCPQASHLASIERTPR